VHELAIVYREELEEEPTNQIAVYQISSGTAGLHLNLSDLLERFNAVECGF